VEKMILGNKCDMNDKRQVILFFWTICWMSSL
jgi:hypothetical protein